MSKSNKFNQGNSGFSNKLFSEIIDHNSSFYEILNNNSKEKLIQLDNVDDLAKAITYFAFRDGPVEDIHTNGNLTDEEMKTLNKYMVNQLAIILGLIKNKEWLKLDMLLEFYKFFGTDWDKAEPDYSLVEQLCNKSLEREFVEYLKQKKS